jgi:hypothetical protein
LIGPWILKNFTESSAGGFSWVGVKSQWWSSGARAACWTSFRAVGSDHPKKENGRVRGAPLSEAFDFEGGWSLASLFSPAEEERGFFWQVG